jgi:hypothetical protein
LQRNISHRFPRPASAPPPALLEEPAEASDYSSVLNGGGAEVSCGDGVQEARISAVRFAPNDF